MLSAGSNTMRAPYGRSPNCGAAAGQRREVRVVTVSEPGMTGRAAHMADFGVSGIDELLAQTRRSLEAISTARAGDTDGESSGSGEALDGQVRASVTGGRLVSLTVEPRLMRLPSGDLCEQIMVAVNAALDDARAAPGADAASPAPVDPQALASQLRGVQEQSLRQMSTFSTAMNELLARMREARG
jgi:hypothetical protein